jgi:hypothetical protein
MKYEFPIGNNNPKFGKNKGADNPMFGRTGKDNPNLGKKRSEETKMKMRLKKLGKNNPMSGTHCNTAEANGMWKGSNVSYSAIHLWVKRRKSKPEYCKSCNEKLPCDLANISGEYSRDLDDWEWLCRKCHMINDGRLARLIAARIKTSLRQDPVRRRLIDKGYAD